MATTIASINLTSADLLSDSLSISAIATLTTAGSSTGLTGTEGLGRKKTANTSEYTLFAAANATDDKAHKIYLKNMSTTASEYFEADSTGTNCDIDITPSANDMTIEYMLLTDE